MDLSRILAGPYATMLLGDLGAEVIKVERPGRGDDTRSWGPPFAAPGQSAYYLCANRNKYSISVDIKSSKGRALISSLAAKSDVLVENFLPGKLDEMGLGYEDLSRINPRLIYCSISGFGATGPYQDRPGYDVIASAMGGLMGITGPENGPPAKVGVAITDVCTGLYAHGAILAALYARSQTGIGQRIDCSLLETQVATLVNIASNYLLVGKVGKPLGTAHESVVPYQAFPTQDGQIVVGALNNEQYFALCDAIGAYDLARDERFKTNPGRVEHRKELLSRIGAIFQSKPTAEWLAVFDGSAFPYGPINDMAQVFQDKQVLHREMVQTIEHPTIGPMRVVGPAVKYSKTPATVRLPPPLLGQHTAEVLKKVLGLKQEEIQRLIDEGVIANGALPAQ